MHIRPLPMLWLCCLGVLLACGDPVPPATPFSPEAVPAAPDYTQARCWASLPTTEDPADGTPKRSTPENQAQADVDVFFIHPTTFRSSEAWNASLDDSSINARTDNLPIRHQASIFNHSCRVFAPRYRQMTYPGFFSEDRASMAQAMEVAYQDVKAAFEHYMATQNDGRPLIIATHSQGTAHGIRLLRELFDGKPLQQQLVAAYLVGWPFPADTFASLPVCHEPSETGCVVGWCSWQQGHLSKDHDSFFAGSVVVNPISWRQDTLLAKEELHRGFVGYKFKKIRAERLHAQVHDGVLWVKKPSPFLKNPDYHIADYNLFWGDVRHNVAVRIKRYVSHKKAPDEE